VIRTLTAAVVLVLGLLPSSAALGAPDAAAVRVWFHSTPGCPDGAAFIELLRHLGRTASLAGVGDRVEFVVTLAHADRQSRGRLERQSTERTVAIRDFSAASCIEVAEVLALSLDLALRPGADAEPAAPPVQTEVGAWDQRLGAQGSIETGLARAVLSGAAVFLEMSPSPVSWRARLSLRGAYAAPDTEVELDVGLLASRLEGCWAWAASAVVLGPCAGFDVGLILAGSSGDAGRSDAGAWSSAVAHVRASWDVGRIALEAQVGLIVPFVRYDFTALTGGTVTGSAPLGFASALGVSFRL
jgi:hypothetical protein